MNYASPGPETRILNGFCSRDTEGAERNRTRKRCFFSSFFFLTIDIEGGRQNWRSKDGQNEGRGGEASLANYFYSFPRNEFRSRREKEREKVLPPVPRCRGKIPRLKRLMAALRIRQDPANGSFFSFFRREAIGIYR